MNGMGLAPVYQEPRTTVPHPEHKKYPYLLRDIELGLPNQVWCAYNLSAYKKGFPYLAAVMGCYGRKIFSWHLSNSIGTNVALQPWKRSVEEAYGKSLGKVCKD